jgi:hypothetical protein
VVFDLLRQRRKRGDIARLPHVGGAQAKLSKDRLMILTELDGLPTDRSQRPDDLSRPRRRSASLKKRPSKRPQADATKQGG